MSDEELVQKTLGGDTASYGALVQKYEAPLLRYITYLLGNPDVAEDVLQDTFIKAYRNLYGFKQHLKFSAWIYRIAHNTAMDAVKRQRKTIVVDTPVLELYTAYESGIAELIDQQILAADLQQCLARLTAKYREPLFLYYFQHKSYQEISDILRIPVSTAGVRIGRAKTQLRQYCTEKGVTP